MTAPRQLVDWQALGDAEWESAARSLLARLERLEPGLRRAVLPAIRPTPPPAAAPERTGALAGVPFLVQDLFDVAGMPTGCGLEPPGRGPPAGSDSGLVARVRRLGGWPAGKSATSPLGIDRAGFNPILGDCPHPSLDGHLPGGGCSGGAWAVASGLVPLAFGLDTNGGVRVPAAFCGLYAFKSGSGELARAGVEPIAPSMDCVGWMTATAHDLAVATRAVCGIEGGGREDLRTGPRGLLLDLPAAAAEGAFNRRMLECCRRLGIEADPDAGAVLRTGLATAGRSYEVLEGRELYAVHRRREDRRRNACGEPLERRIERGGARPVAEVDQAADDRSRVREALLDAFDRFDFLALPVSPVPTPRRPDWDAELEHRIAALAAPATLGALPVVTIPVAGADGRSGGLQLLFGPDRLAAALDLLERLEADAGR